jgi:hypothetical protein
MIFHSKFTHDHRYNKTFSSEIDGITKETLTNKTLKHGKEKSIIIYF